MAQEKKALSSSDDPAARVPVVLWLRPFDLADGYPEYDFQELLTLSVEDIAVAVTLKDARTWNSAPGELKGFTTKRVIGVSWLVHIALVVYVWLRWSWEDGTVFRVLTLLTAIGYTWRAIAPKPKNFSKVDSLSIATDQLDLLKSGVSVLKCPDGDWNEIIREYLKRSRVVIIDLTDSSSSLVWELHESVKTLGTKRIILACRSNDDHYPTLVPDRLRQTIAPLNCCDFRLFSIRGTTKTDGRTRICWRPNFDN